MKRGYQHNFSGLNDTVFDVAARENKASTAQAVLQDWFGDGLGELKLLNVGGSAGIIDRYLSRSFGLVLGVDIDELAIRHAQQNFAGRNLCFSVADAMCLPFAENSLDVVMCSHVYEHVPSAEQLMSEIYRVLKPGGVCYFSGSNRFMFMEPHYRLPLLSAIPRPLAHLYFRLAGKGAYYHELHYSYWGLCRLMCAFTRHDYTGKILQDPKHYRAEYMLPPGSRKLKVARWVNRYLYGLMPGYIWLLQKPETR